MARLTPEGPRLWPGADLRAPADCSAEAVPPPLRFGLQQHSPARELHRTWPDVVERSCDTSRVQECLPARQRWRRWFRSYRVALTTRCEFQQHRYLRPE